jgi:hypothetical protein
MKTEEYDETPRFLMVQFVQFSSYVTVVATARAINLSRSWISK